MKSVGQVDSRDEGGVSGVLLSVPLDANHHAVGNSARYDNTQSWSLSKSIRLVTSSTSFTVEVDVYNLGLDISFATVEVVLWYREYEFGREYEWTAERHRLKYGLFVPAFTPQGAGRTTTKRVTLPLKTWPFELTHVYGVAYDSLFDPADSDASALLNLHVSFSSNPARESRQVGCLNVPCLANGGFKVERKYRHVEDTITIFLSNQTGCPFDIVVDRIDNAPPSPTRIGVTDGRNFRSGDVRHLKGVLINYLWYAGYELGLGIGVETLDPSCYPNCAPHLQSGKALAFLTGAGQVTVNDGKPQGNGNVVHAKFDLEWIDNSAEIAHVYTRFLIR